MKRILIISNTLLHSSVKLDEMLKDIPTENVNGIFVGKDRKLVEFKNGDSIEALCFNETMRGKRAEILYLSKSLTVEQCEYCHRYLRDYDGQWAEVVFFD